MFGFGDMGVWSAYAFTFLSVLICLVYGIMNWNEGKDEAKGGKK